MPCSPSSALHLEGHPAHVVPGDTGARIEVDAQLVGVVQVARADRVRVQLHAPEVRDEGEPRHVVDHDLLGGAPRGEAQRRGADPGGPTGGRALLVERRRVGAVDEPLEDDGAVADPLQRAVGHG